MRASLGSRAQDQQQETARIAARKGRKGLAIVYDPRRWGVGPPSEGGDDDAVAGRVVLVHRPRQGRRR